MAVLLSYMNLEVSGYFISMCLSFPIRLIKAGTTPFLPFGIEMPLLTNFHLRKLVGMNKAEWQRASAVSTSRRWYWQLKAIILPHTVP